MSQKLFILPFDHRTSFAELLGLDYSNLTPDDRAVIADRKFAIYEGVLRAIELGISRESVAILVDEEFGIGIHSEARIAGITRILTAESSGGTEFSFAYGDQFGAHIDAIHPEYVKALVHFNRDDDAGINGRLFENLRTLNIFCSERGYKFLLEVLFPNGASAPYVASCISDFQTAGVEPDIWKIAGFPTEHEVEIVALQVQGGGRGDVGVVILGRGESQAVVENWISAAHTVPGVVGFAVGRTIFAEPIRAYHVGEITRTQAIENIATGFIRFANLFEASLQS